MLRTIPLPERTCSARSFDPPSRRGYDCAACTACAQTHYFPSAANGLCCNWGVKATAMRKRMVIAAILAALALTALDTASAAHAAGVARTRQMITFEGLAGRKKIRDIPPGYDGFNWDAILVAGKNINKGDPDGFEAVVHGIDAANTLETAQNTSHGSFSSVNGQFSLKKGHFASMWNIALQVTFSGYRSGVLVGQKTVSMDQADTVVEFDDTFKNIDTVAIDGSGGTQGTGEGSGYNVAMDNLVVSF